MPDLPTAAGTASVTNILLQRLAQRSPLLMSLKTHDPALYDALTGAALATVLQLIASQQAQPMPEPPRDHPQYPLV